MRRSSRATDDRKIALVFDCDVEGFTSRDRIDTYITAECLDFWRERGYD